MQKKYKSNGMQNYPKFQTLSWFWPRDASAERGYEIACRPSVRPSVRDV